MDLETYLRGVVPREMGPGEFPAIEALKAQAVAARTYAYANLGKRAKDGFDLLDTVADQVYGGKDGEQPLTDRAVQETTGLIATWNGRPIQALFMANSAAAPPWTTTTCSGTASRTSRAVSNYLDAPADRALQGQPVRPGRRLAHLRDPAPGRRGRAAGGHPGRRPHGPAHAGQRHPAGGGDPGPEAGPAPPRRPPGAWTATAAVDRPGPWVSRRWWRASSGPRTAPTLLGDLAPQSPPGPAPGRLPGPARAGAPGGLAQPPPPPWPRA